MSYRSNPFKKDNPRWANSNAAETTKVPSVVTTPLLTSVITTWDHPGGDPAGDPVTGIGERTRALGGIAISWLMGLPRRAGARLHARGDREAVHWGWQVTETFGGLNRQYRDPRFDALRLDPSLRRAELTEDPPQTDWPCGGGL
jgi:hypothetical protein